MTKEEEKNLKLPLFGILRLLPFLKPYRWIMLLMILLGFASSLIDSAYPLFNRYALDHFIGEKTLAGAGTFAALYLGVLLFQVIDNFVTASLCGKIEMSVNRDLRNAAFSHLQTLSFSYFNQNNVGYIHARVMSDSGKIGLACAWRMMDLVWHGAYILCVCIMMLTVDVRLALMIFALVPVTVVFIIVFQRKFLILHRRVRELNSTITGDFNEGVTGARSIKTLVVEDRIREDFERDTEEMRSTAVSAERTRAFFTSVVSLMSAFALAIVLWKGGQLTLERLMMIGSLSVFMSYAINLMEPIRMIMQTLSAFVEIQVNIERLTKLLNTQSDVADSPEVVEKYGDTFRPKRENWEELHGDVEFEDVSFQYPDGEELVLEHFNLKVPHGTNVAIVGETGAGKSTLVNLVCRFFEPTEGRVLIDGRDARERSQLWLHSHIGYVLQTPHLFSGTVRENLCYGKPDATDEEIRRALALVSADAVVDRMEKGLDSQVGESGDLLSTGEKQLLSFARAILADPRILVLDEATSSIDTVTEKKIQEAIATVIKGRTSFVIAHRLSTIVDADVILMVNEGKIIEQGTHRELMKKKGAYYELYTRQYEEMAADLV
ncbi:MAG: ABC transporter ATP-binding protein/permease [Lachnospiraceae bacterium]|nr:ABC transporter ATP-binding protein/permease [Lachnospiraceae bacterium]